MSVIALTAWLLGSATGAAQAEVSEVRLSMQFGFSTLPMFIMKHNGYVEQELKKAGLQAKVAWHQFSGAGPMQDALFSNNLDFMSNGTTNLITVWSKTGGKIKSLGSVSAIPNYLLCNDARIHSIRDLKTGDRIAVPTAKVSPQAFMLEMASEKAFGNWRKIDPLVVSMRHPDAAAALMSGGVGLTCHFSVPPYEDVEMANPKVHRVTSNIEILGGDASVVVLSTTTDFHAKNPKTVKAVRAALDDAMQFIQQHKQETAQIYIEETHEKVTPAEIVKVLNDPHVHYTVNPENVMKFARFMHKVGIINNEPANWKDLFFPEAHNLAGS